MITTPATPATPTIPEAVSHITVGELVAWVVGISAAISTILYFGKRAWRAANQIQDFVSDWRGQPERRDSTGAIIEPSRPGVPAIIEEVRNQVQNSHSTNLRDDLDRISRSLEEHIEIAKQSDRRQEETAQKVDQLADDVTSLRRRYDPHDITPDP